MIDYQLFRYASPPRTATTWVRKAAVLAGLHDSSRNHVHVPHDPVDTSLKVMTIRHPCDWLASYYAAIYPGSIGVPEVDKWRWNGTLPDFNQFIRIYLTTYAGHVDQMFGKYNADVMIKVENLPWAFIELLDSLGVPKVMRERCLAINAQNTTKRELLPRWSPSLRAQVEDCERDFLERYEY